MFVCTINVYNKKRAYKCVWAPSLFKIILLIFLHRLVQPLRFVFLLSFFFSAHFMCGVKNLHSQEREKEGGGEEEEGINNQ